MQIVKVTSAVAELFVAKDFGIPEGAKVTQGIKENSILIDILFDIESRIIELFFITEDEIEKNFHDLNIEDVQIVIKK